MDYINTIIPPVMRPMPDEKIAALLGCPVNEVKYLLAKDYPSAQDLTVLARARNPYVRMDAYHHPNMPLSVLYDAMVCDPNNDMCIEAANVFFQRTNDGEDAPDDMPDAGDRVMLAWNPVPLAEARRRSIKARRDAKNIKEIR